MDIGVALGAQKVDSTTFARRYEIGSGLLDRIRARV